MSTENIVDKINKLDPQELNEWIESLDSVIQNHGREAAKIILETSKLDIKPSMIQLAKEIKALGVFKVKINLHSEVQAEISIKVVAEETIQ